MDCLDKNITQECRFLNSNILNHRKPPRSCNRNNLHKDARKVTETIRYLNKLNGRKWDGEKLIVIFLSVMLERVPHFSSEAIITFHLCPPISRTISSTFVLLTLKNQYLCSQIFSILLKKESKTSPPTAHIPLATVPSLSTCLHS